MPPLADAEFICPIDGAISQFGAIERDQIFPSQGRTLPQPRRWLAATANWPPSFRMVALPHSTSARDYHRIHMPCAGRLTR